MKKMKAKKGEKQCLTILNCCKSSFLSFDILKFYNIFAIALHWKTSVLLCRHHAWSVTEPGPSINDGECCSLFCGLCYKIKRGE